MIGHRFAPVQAHVEAGRLRNFRKVIGCAQPGEQTAPPTYLFALEMIESENPMAFIEDLGIDMAKLLHSEQSFTYFAPVRAGDRILLETVVTDIFEKKGGALLFVVQDTKATNQHGAHVATVRRTLVIRN
ncbi:MaoC family dehydratase N-terminal domain-containing protein [Sphingobium estronivorans]|uniref:MaoC family dehydratase N-terminal domain-containing protein n=1 Tax=Sphingobium estronivorans TaxID=1577690 RepID=UPI001967DA89|nr:MaoC family dehydratase N-terminal domain-containing protein [Sphingobium estronivorans]